MNAGALLLITAGVWGLCQLFGGDALGRLGIAGAPTKPGSKNLVPGSVSGSSGLPAAAYPAPSVPGGGPVVSA